MSYLVLARKYRPRTFGDVVGQDHVVRPLANALRSGRVAHAYLFAGARGVGKTTCARLLAMALNCRAEALEERPCGRCESCLEIIEGHAVDVYEIDGASNRRIEEVRNLRETVKYLPSKSRLKVYIIDEVHMLTKEAFNALLKTLEEPPAHVVFIFATTETHKVLPTILSRCQRYDFHRLDLAEIVGRLEEIARAEGLEAETGAFRLIARESEGCLRDALSLFDQVIAFSGPKVREANVTEALGLIDQTLIAGLVQSVLAGEAGEALEVLDRVYNFGYDTQDFAVQVVEYLRALVVAKVSRTPGRILDLLDAELAEVVGTAGKYSLETLNFHFQAWLEVQGRLKWAPHPRLVLEALIIRLAQTEPLQPLAELAARLEALLAAAGGEPGPAPPAGGRPSGSGPTVPRSGPAGGRLFQPEASPAAAVPAPAPAPEVSGTWPAFIEAVRAESPVLANILTQRGRADEFGPDRVEIVVHQKNGADLVDNKKLADLLSVFFGRRPRIGLRFEENLPGPEEEARNLAAAEQERLKEEILGHPLVQEARKIFPGQVIEIKPDQGEGLQ
ncbi:MAG: DNA polymerase III subunit gamma/tau [Thermodesulfobacteriota bacterium]